MRVASQSANRKIRDIAQTVVLTGELAVTENQVRPRPRDPRKRRATCAEQPDHSTKRSEPGGLGFDPNGPTRPALPLPVQRHHHRVKDGPNGHP